MRGPTALTWAEKKQKVQGVENQHSGKSRDNVALMLGEKPSKIQHYIRLTYLIEPFLAAVDSKDIKVGGGVALSYYDAATQEVFLQFWQEGQLKLSNQYLAAAKKQCPPPTASVEQILAVKANNHTILVSAEASRTITFGSKKLMPYLAGISDEEIEGILIEAVKSRKV